MKKHNDLTLDELVQQITSSVDPSWDVLKQIRYVYIELGLYLNRNESLLDNLVSSIKNVKRVESDIEVKSQFCSLILKKCLDKINVESRILNSDVVVNDIKLSLFNDLVPLKYNMITNIDSNHLDEILKTDSEFCVSVFLERIRQHNGMKKESFAEWYVISILTDLISGAVDLNEIYRRYYSEEYESFEEYLYKKELLEIETIIGIKLRSDQSLWRLRFTRNNYSIKSILGYEDENLQIINKTLEYVLNEN